MKRHGFCHPLHCLQVTAWVTVALLATLFYSIIAVNLASGTQAAFVVIYSMALVCTIISCLICTRIDPTDEAVKLANGIKVSNLTYDYTKFPRLCVKCSTHVGSRSKHCAKCNRCAAEFDHHCNWLNNCIGKDNYHWFIFLILSLEVCALLEIIATLFLIKEVFNDSAEGNDLKRKYEIKDGGYTYVSTLMGAAVICVCIIVPNGYLILFHVYLRVRHITTYEYIVARRNPRRRISQVHAAPHPSHIENTSLQLDQHLSNNESRPIIVPQCTPMESVAKSVSLRKGNSVDAENKPVSHTLEMNSLPSFVDKPTELGPGASLQHRNAREDSVVHMDDEAEYAPGDEEIRLKLRQHSSPAWT